MFVLIDCVLIMCYCCVVLICMSYLNDMYIYIYIYMFLVAASDCRAVLRTCSAAAARSTRLPRRRRRAAAAPPWPAQGGEGGG